ncbi:hypothetical protein ACFL1H_00595 [Nanoarchaeota archaeon]
MESIILQWYLAPVWIFCTISYGVNAYNNFNYFKMEARKINHKRKETIFPTNNYYTNTLIWGSLTVGSTFLTGCCIYDGLEKLIN